jgi:hypothetical protein
MGDYFTHKRKMDAVNEADSEGHIADSMNVRRDIVRRMHAGEITLAEGQAELAAIKRGAKKAGKITRAEAYSRG